MKPSLVASDIKKLQKKSKQKNECVKGCPKWQLTQIWSLEILGFKGGK
jgi:hypothetical protein